MTVQESLSQLQRWLRLVNRRRLQRRQESRRTSYAQWVQTYDTLSPAHRDAFDRRSAQLPQRLDVLLLLPLLRENLLALQSVFSALRDQRYPHWRLAVACGFAASRETQAWLRLQAADDLRIEVLDGPHEPSASFDALQQTAFAAGADVIAVISDRVVLREHALLLVVEAFANHPAAKVVYSDEDRITETRQRCSARFKPDWNPELLLSGNYVGSFISVKADHFRSRGGLRAESPFESAHDLALRCTEGLSPDEVLHIPHVLYHEWQFGTGTDFGEEASVAAVTQHLARQRRAGSVSSESSGYCRVRFTLSRPPHVSIVIPTRNGLRLLRNCVDSIVERTEYPSFDIVIVDNGSDDPDCLAYLNRLRSTSRVTVVSDGRPFNYSALNNAAVARTEGSLIALMNNDIEVITAGWLEEMASLAMLPETGAVGARLWYGDRTLQHGGVILGIGGGAGHAHKHATRDQGGHMDRAWRLQAMSAVTAACLVVLKRKFEEVGGLDEQLFPVAFNDVDLCLKLSSIGYRNLWTPHAELFHHESATRGSDKSPDKRARFEQEKEAALRKWGELLSNDPAYNPNLGLENGTFELALPPRVSYERPWFENKRVRAGGGEEARK